MAGQLDTVVAAETIATVTTLAKVVSYW